MSFDADADFERLLDLNIETHCVLCGPYGWGHRHRVTSDEWDWPEDRRDAISASGRRYFAVMSFGCVSALPRMGDTRLMCIIIATLRFGFRRQMFSLRVTGKLT